MLTYRKKLALVAFVIIVALIGVGITTTVGWRPFVGPRARQLTDRHFEASPGRLARGKYLVNSVAGCFACHSPADYKKAGAPPLEGRLGAGQPWPEKPLAWLVAPNITPDKETGIGNWSDDSLARAIREGIGHDGRALFPVMPYQSYRNMSDEDLASIIVYLRTTPPIRNELPANRIPFPTNFLIKSLPEPIYSPVAAPDQSTQVARGAYLVRMGSCADCHTPQDGGQPIAGLDFAGGSVLEEPTGTLTSANITPDPSGISYYDENLFIHAMREGRVGARQLNAVMPWSTYGLMSDDDLKAIFAYLRTLKPVKHRVDNIEPPTECKLCRHKHGLGDKN